MPTRNRAKLLTFAVQSVLNQTFDDFEIIISDNFSSDNTEEISKNFDDKRIKYYRSETSLSMGDSWEFALNHASGEYICFLSDDDAYAKTFLQKMFQTIEEEKSEIVTASLTPYYAADTFAYGRNITKNSLVIKPFDRRTYVLDKKEALTSLFSQFQLTRPIEKHSSVNVPQLVNSTYHASLLKRVRNRINKIFPIVGSDIYTSALFLNSSEKYCYINEPLYLYAIWEGSETAGEQSLFEKNPEERKMEYVPLKNLLSLPNYGANAILRAKADWGEDFQVLPIDFGLYFPPLFKQLKYLEANNIDVSIDLKEFEEVLAKQDTELQKRVRSVNANNSSLLDQKIKAKFKKTILGKIALKFKNRAVKIFRFF